MKNERNYLDVLRRLMCTIAEDLENENEDPDLYEMEEESIKRKLKEFIDTWVF